MNFICTYTLRLIIQISKLICHIWQRLHSYSNQTAAAKSQKLNLNSEILWEMWSALILIPSRKSFFAHYMWSNSGTYLYAEMLAHEKQTHYISSYVHFKDLI